MQPTAQAVANRIASGQALKGRRDLAVRLVPPRMRMSEDSRSEYLELRSADSFILTTVPAGSILSETRTDVQANIASASRT